MRSTYTWTSLVLLIVVGVLCTACGGETTTTTTKGEESPAPTAGVDTPPGLLGLWVSSEKGNNGNTMYLVINPDGTAARGMAIMVDFKYEIHGKKLQIVDQTMRPGETFDIDVDIQGDDMHQKMPLEPGDPQTIESRSRRIERVSGQTEGIVGVWERSGGLGAVYERFGVDGTMLHRVLIDDAVLGAATTYEIAEDRITLIPEGGQQESFEFELSDDTLILRKEGSVAFRFVRGPHGPWFLRPDSK